MNARIKQLAVEAQLEHCVSHVRLEHFANLILKECIDKIETYRIPVGNSRSGELACEWTYNALKDIRDEIKELYEKAE